MLLGYLMRSGGKADKNQHFVFNVVYKWESVLEEKIGN